ncbi:hypothetical protein LINPERHAP2_LOCUS19114 [Linum perenne]
MGVTVSKLWKRLFLERGKGRKWAAAATIVALKSLQIIIIFISASSRRLKLFGAPIVQTRDLALSA